MVQVLEWLALGLIPAFLLLDFVLAARDYVKPRFWRLRGLAVTVAIVLFSGEVAAFWGAVFGDRSLFDLSGLGMVTGAVLGVLVYELAHYWYHRFAHEWDWLWRASHQMHHSAESLDAFGAYYLHPFDAAMFTTIGSLVFFPLLGVLPEAGMIAALFLTFNAMFQHANIRTPHWLGYMIQRPESHNIHHGRGIHRYNYCDLPIIDILFGTFKNPSSVDGIECGFYKGASSRIPEMLAGVDVYEPRKQSQNALDEVSQDIA
jgi:sterol desaturase/sphingolipid hydroxylase (fatty acid hydroxylase superfamily)